MVECSTTRALDFQFRDLSLGQQLIAVATAYLFSHFGCQIACPRIQPFRPDQATGAAVYLYGSLVNIRGAVVRWANTAPVGDCGPPPAPTVCQRPGTYRAAFVFCIAINCQRTLEVADYSNFTTLIKYC